MVTRRPSRRPASSARPRPAEDDPAYLEDVLEGRVDADDGVAGLIAAERAPGTPAELAGLDAARAHFAAAQATGPVADAGVSRRGRVPLLRSIAAATLGVKIAVGTVAAAATVAGVAVAVSVTHQGHAPQTTTSVHSSAPDPQPSRGGRSGATGSFPGPLPRGVTKSQVVPGLPPGASVAGPAATSPPAAKPHPPAGPPGRTKPHPSKKPHPTHPTHPTKPHPTHPSKKPHPTHPAAKAKPSKKPHPTHPAAKAQPSKKEAAPMLGRDAA